MTKVLDQTHMASMTRKAKGHMGSRKSCTEKGVEAKVRRTKGTCSDCITSTTCARNTKSGTSSTPAPSRTRSRIRESEQIDKRQRRDGYQQRPAGVGGS